MNSNECYFRGPLQCSVSPFLPSFLVLYCLLPYRQIMSTRFILRQVSHLHKYMWIKFAEISVDLRWSPVVYCDGVKVCGNYCSVLDRKCIPCLRVERLLVLLCFCFALTLRAESAAAQRSCDVSRTLIFLIILPCSSCSVAVSSFHLHQRQEEEPVFIS